jgi:hypothetical protein
VLVSLDLSLERCEIGVLDMPDAKAEHDECPADGLAVVMRGLEPPDLHGIILVGDDESDAARARRRNIIRLLTRSRATIDLRRDRRRRLSLELMAHGR